jgi:hypothetical protein
MCLHQQCNKYKWVMRYLEFIQCLRMSKIKFINLKHLLHITHQSLKIYVFKDSGKIVLNLFTILNEMRSRENKEQNNVQIDYKTVCQFQN